MLKEHRRLIIVPRETPLSVIHLQNMYSLSKMGVVILPPCIGFYTKPKTLSDVINHLVGKILDTLEIEHNLLHAGTELINDLVGYSL